MPIPTNYYSDTNTIFKFRESKKSDEKWGIDSSNYENEIEQQKKAYESLSMSQQVNSDVNHL